MMRLGVLASGSGSNLQSILDACARGAVQAQVAVLICNVPGAGALERAARAGVPCRVLPHKSAPSREAYDELVVAELRQHGVDLVCLAGFMRLVTPVLLRSFENKILNIHPALLPAFPGLHAVRQAVAAGVRVAGCTVHLVDEGTDSGPIVMQAVVPVLDDDTEETLAARVLVQEHRIYPRSIALFAEGRVKLDGRRVVVDAGNDSSRSLVSP
ncbi:MAG TPA: phosphoribosylglycinamide formyltransferase, partial [Myxococcales bacterium]|nr:phosphoribosylglycinamide formyltransferase [Myxococcales bacterium]